ncbi:hypothetical protein CC85DRAFT_292755 [Cutaneotrichosporon oleaginosum]|uniref:Uncharacterized protein n=1 Tax=Cutaneotrichosporon oleaginosum TaxID=879819 RepID=A0A0J0XJN3_9TREE|nr:uncharacterized protein CC85DRAFT_292755 [Cutaneotrichosporon oleaginosum]KLT41320.1 hypothetical protein CC85DRAFT_292755 [Cutaneotrichosporon oleaginosum]TXT14070.1 hypothetical protein COLE_00263 [Cutaneotrichosporon oleaginosum]
MPFITPGAPPAPPAPRRRRSRFMAALQATRDARAEEIRAAYVRRRDRRAAQDRTSSDPLIRYTQQFIDATDRLNNIILFLQGLFGIPLARGQAHTYGRFLSIYHQTRQSGERARCLGFSLRLWNARAIQAYEKFAYCVRVAHFHERRQWGWKGTSGGDIMELMYEAVSEVIAALRKVSAAAASVEIANIRRILAIAVATEPPKPQQSS